VCDTGGELGVCTEGVGCEVSGWMCDVMDVGWRKHIELSLTHKHV